MTSAIGYCRVSTNKQGEGHSLDGQAYLLNQWADTNDIDLVDIRQEVASGGDCQRPILLQAVEDCQTTGARLVVVKLDRLARDVGFICELLKTPKLNVDVIELGGNCDPLVVHIFASIAEHQRRYISIRTKEGLRQAKRNGVKLGNPSWQSALTTANKKKTENANGFALRLRPALIAMGHMGHSTYAAKARALNEMGHRTRRGFKFHSATVRNLELRISEMEACDG